MTEQHNGVKDLGSLTKNGHVLPTKECAVLTTGQAGKSQDISFLFFFNCYFYFILLYNTVLVLPYIDMNPPRVYMRSQT